MKRKRFSSESLFGLAAIGIVLIWISFRGFSAHAAWALVPLALLAVCRLKCDEPTRLFVDAGIISIAGGLVVFVFLSFLLPNVFMPHWVVALIAALPATVVAATLFFYFTRPASRHARIHELEALSFLVFVVTAAALLMPQFLVAISLSEDFAVQEAGKDYWMASQLLDRSYTSNSDIPEVLAEYAHGYLDEVSALAWMWQDDPPDRCAECVQVVHEILKPKSMGAIQFAQLAHQLDAYLLMLESDPEEFVRIETCVAASSPRTQPMIAYDRPGDVPRDAHTVVGEAMQNYVVTSDVFLSGYEIRALSVAARQDVVERSLGVADSIAASGDEMRVLSLLRRQYVNDVRDCSAVL